MMSDLLHRLVRSLPGSRRSRRPAPRGNALVLVAAILLMLGIIGMGYIVRTQGSREVASATQSRAIVDTRIDAIAGTIVDEVASSLFVRPMVQPPADPSVPYPPEVDPGLNPAFLPAGVPPTGRSDWPRRKPEPTATRYGIDPIDGLVNLLDPGARNGLYATGSDGYPDGYNFAPYSVRPWTNWPDLFGTIYGESNPLGNPGFGDLRWLASTEPQRATWNGTEYVPDPLGDTFSHWAHLSWLPTAENGYRVVPDISDVERNVLTGPQGTPLVLPANPANINAFTSFGGLGIPYEQWLQNVPPAPLQSAADFINRRNRWFSPGGYYEAVTDPFAAGGTWDSRLMLPNLIRLADPLDSGTILAPGTRPTDAGPTLFKDGVPDNANNTIRNIIERTFADSDGDGITDSFWYLAPSSVDRGVRQLVALRIVDNSGLLNVNVASRFQRRNRVPDTADAPAMRETRGHTPGDLALVSDNDDPTVAPSQDVNLTDTAVGFLNSHENWLMTGEIESSPDMTVAFDTEYRWRGTDENNPTFLRERGIQRSSADGTGAPGAWDLFTEELRLQSERTRLFKSSFEDGAVRYFNAPPGSSLPLPEVVDASQPDYAPGGLTAPLSPFSAADEVELRMSHGQNQPFVLSRLERALNVGDEDYAFLRSPQWREEASEWTGKQLSIPELLADNRRKLTTISAARNDILPPALWTRWWNVDPVSGRYRPIEKGDVLHWYGPPSTAAELRHAYPTLAALTADLVAGDPPAVAPVPAQEIFTTGGWRPEVIRAVAGDANGDGVLDARDLDAARRDFFAWNSKLDLRAPIDLDRVGGENPVVDAQYGVFGDVTPGGAFFRSADGEVDMFDHAFSTIEWTEGFRRRALAALKSEYLGAVDPTTGLPRRTVASYADRFQAGSDMIGETSDPKLTFRPLTGTKRPKSITGDTGNDAIDDALKSAKVTDAMAASLAANAATARRGPMRIGPFDGSGAASWFTSQPLLPAHPGPVAGDGNVPDQRVPAKNPNPDHGSGPEDINFAGIEGHPVVMEAFFAVVWPKTRLGSTWQFIPGPGTTLSNISPKPVDPYSIPVNYEYGGDESHFVAIVPRDKFVDGYLAAQWGAVAPEDWQRQSTAVVAVQVANPFPYPIPLGDFELNVFGQTYRFPRYESDAGGNTIFDTDGNPIPLMLGPTTEAEPRTAIVFAITDHNQINYKPGDSVLNQNRYPLTKGVEFDPFFRTRWLDYLDILESADLPGVNPNLQTASLSGATPTAFCPHTQGIDGTEASQADLSTKFPRRRLLGTSRQSRSLFGCMLSPDNPIAQSKIIDATQALGTDVAAYRPSQGISIRRVLYNPDPASATFGTPVELPPGLLNDIVDRFDVDPGDTDQTEAHPVSGWNFSMAAELIKDPGGRFWPPRIDDGHSADEDQMYPIWNAPPQPPPSPQYPPPWKPQQNNNFNGIRIDKNDYYVTWTRASRLWGKDFAVVYGTNGDPVAFDRDPANNNGKGDGMITPDERAPRFVFASSKQRPDLPGSGGATTGALLVDGIGPFRGKSGDPYDYRGAAFQAQVGLTPWVNDLTYNYPPNPQPYPLPPTLKNPANTTITDAGCGDPDIVGEPHMGFPLKGNHLLPLVRNFTTGVHAKNTSGDAWPPQNFTGDLNAEIMRVAMKPTSFPTKTVVGIPDGEMLPRQIFGLDFSVDVPTGVKNAIAFLADKGMRPPVSDTTMDAELTGGAAIAAALDRLLPMDGAFTLGQKRDDFDTTAEVLGLMVWGPVQDQTKTLYTLGEILTDRVPGYPVGLVHRYVDLDGNGISDPYEQNPAWAYLNRICVDNPGVAFSWFDRNGMEASPPSQRFLWQWGGSSAAVGPYASSLPLGSRLLEAFTLDDRGTTIAYGAHAWLPASTDMNGDGFDSPRQANETMQWLEDRRFRLAGGYKGRGTPGLINVNTAPVEVLRAMPHMSRLVYNDGFDNDGDRVGDMFDVDSDGDGILDDWRIPPRPQANPIVRVPEAMELYRSRTPPIAGWRPNPIFPSRPWPDNDAAVPHYFDTGFIPGDEDGDNVQDTGFFPGMRAERGFESLGEALLLTRNTAAPWQINDWTWADNQSWSVRFAGLDPFRVAQAPNDNHTAIGGGYRQLDPNGDYLNPPYGARISTDTFRGRRLEFWNEGVGVGVREVPVHAPTAGDAREQNLLLSSLSNILTTRSDVFTVYLRVRSVKPDPITGRYDGTDPELIVSDSRYVMCIDRSRVERPGDPPRIVYFQKVPN